MTDPRLQLVGQSGRRYRFQFERLDGSLSVLPGVYCVVAQSSAGGVFKMLCIYVGQSASVALRLEKHHRQKCFRAHGATHVGFLFEEDVTSRMAIEDDLIVALKPTCNPTCSRLGEQQGQTVASQ